MGTRLKKSFYQSEKKKFLTTEKISQSSEAIKFLFGREIMPQTLNSTFPILTWLHLSSINAGLPLITKFPRKESALLTRFVAWSISEMLLNSFETLASEMRRYCDSLANDNGLSTKESPSEIQS